VFKRVASALLEYLRINAIRRMLRIVDVRRGEIAGLAGLAAVFAVFEGLGLTMLLPVLQYAEGSETAIAEGGGPVWGTVDGFMTALSLPRTLPVLLALAFAPILLRQVVFYGNTWYSAVVAGRIGLRMRMATLDAVLHADPEFFTRHTVGHLTGIVITQTAVAGQAVLAVIKQLAIGLLMALYVAIMFAISAPLTLIALAFAALIALIIQTSVRRIRTFGIEAARFNQELYAKVVERLGLIRLVKLRNQEDAEAARIDDYSERMRDIAVKQARIGARIEVTADPLLMLSVFVTLFIGISVLHMTLAQLGMMLFVLSRLNAKVKEFNGGRQAISANMAGILLVRETLANARAADTINGGTLPFPGLQRELVLADVAFKYPTESGPEDTGPAASTVLSDVSLAIPAGSFTAIVGRSGAGKSTLVELLPRLREATSGRITYDGTDIRDFEVGSLRRGIGYLTQNAMLFNDTVRANLAYGLGYEPADEQVRSALERAYATFVYDLPAGLETQLGDRGVRFSGGEQQRIALARVLLADTSVLILDEPTSALDSESEVYIQKALAGLHGTKTVIVIAHRLATVIQADQLLVIEDGRIVERGTHAELVAHEGAYHRLFESQLLG
jgi:subfamily B ATP-binding cassette protein MsbA